MKNTKYKIAIFSPLKTDISKKYVITIIQILKEKNHTIVVEEKIYHLVRKKLGDDIIYFNKKTGLPKEIEFFFSIGGDGSLLKAIHYVKDSSIPILGINTGSLGFLTSLQKESIITGIEHFFEKKYNLIERSVLEIHFSENQNFDSILFPFALNEIAFQRKESTSLLSIYTELNNKTMTTYLSDGLIIATPTGSTGYSLSNGGPILAPETNGWVLTPIAPHNLNMRPLVVPDNVEIKIQIKTNEKKYLLSLDSQIFSVPNDIVMTIRKAYFSVFTVELKNQNFFKTLKNKLLWGLDTRNFS